MSARKVCARCKVLQPLSAFGANNSKRDGLSVYCRPCTSAMYKASQARSGRRAGAGKNATPWRGRGRPRKDAEAGDDGETIARVPRIEAILADHAERAAVECART